MSRSPGRERWAFLGLAYTLLAISATAAVLAHAPTDVAPWPAVRWLAGPLVTWLSDTAAPGAPVSPSTVSPPPGWPVPDRLVPGMPPPGWPVPDRSVPGWPVPDRSVPGWPTPGWLVSDQSVPGWLPTGWSMPGWPALALVAAVWVAPVAWLHPRRDRHRALVMAHYLVLVLLAGALIVASPAFILFAAIGYPLAIAMLPARLVMAGVTLTAVVNVAAQAGQGAGATLPTVLAGVALPLVIAGWYVAGEHDKRRRLVGRLRAAVAENADLNARLLGQARRAGMLDERHRVAGEIHDTVAQDLVALIGQLDAAERARDDPARRRHLDQAAELARRSLSEARRSVRALHPEQLEDARLPEAVTRMAESWSKSSGVDLTLEITGTPVALAADVEAALFRVAQEALANVAKHARATRTGLTLSYTDETILLDIRDNGTGFTPQEPGDGFGLDGMRQRVRGVGGTLTIESEPGGGTAVAAAVPSIPAEGT